MVEKPDIILLAGILGYGPALLLIDRFDKLWPKVELQIGPKHTFLEENRRNIFIGVVVSLLLPIIFGFIFS